MIKEFEPITQGLLTLIKEWEPKLSGLSKSVITERRNSQNRTIKQIVGHMIDSASNNTHRIVHLQYRASPLRFPNYATYGNNDRWIAIQNYQDEDWENMINMWKFSNLHIVHVMNNVDPSKLENEWFYDEKTLISLKDGIIDYLRHFKLHLDEILLDGNALKITGQGSIDLKDATANIIVLAAPFKTVDRLVNKIPIFRYITGGSLVSVPLRLHGKIKDLSVVPLPPSAVGKGLLQFMERTLKAP